MASRSPAGSSSVKCGAFGPRWRFSVGRKGVRGCEMGIAAAAEVGSSEKLRERRRFFTAFLGGEQRGVWRVWEQRKAEHPLAAQSSAGWYQSCQLP